MSILPIAGIGVPGMFRDPGEKKFSSAECLDALITRLIEEPELIRNQFNIVTREESGEMTKTFWPAVLDPACWTRLSTHRPNKDSEGESLGGTNREVREFENDFWADHRKHLVGTVTTEFGEITEVKVVARW